MVQREVAVEGKNGVKTLPIVGYSGGTSLPPSSLLKKVHKQHSLRNKYVFYFSFSRQTQNSGFGF